MIMENVSMCIAVSARTLIYLQGLKAQNLIPANCLILAENEKDIYKNVETFTDVKKYDYVNLDDTIGEFLSRNGIKYTIMETNDINSDKALGIIKDVKQKYIIYSGYGGCILKNHLFEIGKQWIHVHAGKLPNYRGSTTAYYSIIQEHCISATAIFMSRGIDEGNIICSASYDIPSKEINIDYVYEPYIRSKVLNKALKQYFENGAFEKTKQSNIEAETYYIIHPVLKHIALMSLK